MQKRYKYLKLKDAILLSDDSPFLQDKIFSYSNEFYVELGISLDSQKIGGILPNIYSSIPEEEKDIEIIIHDLVMRNDTIKENILLKWNNEIDSIRRVAEDFKMTNIFHYFIEFHLENPEGSMKNISWENTAKFELAEIIQIISTLTDPNAWDSFILEFLHHLNREMISINAELNGTEYPELNGIESKKMKEILERNLNHTKIKYISYERSLNEIKGFFTTLYPRMINLQRYQYLADFYI
jgi:hypothetical protein